MLVVVDIFEISFKHQALASLRRSIRLTRGIKGLGSDLCLRPGQGLQRITRIRQRHRLKQARKRHLAGAGSLVCNLCCLLRLALGLCRAVRHLLALRAGHNVLHAAPSAQLPPRGQEGEGSGREQGKRA